jgi:hypothetical protein
MVALASACCVQSCETLRCGVSMSRGSNRLVPSNCLHFSWGTAASFLDLVCLTHLSALSQKESCKLHWWQPLSSPKTTRQKAMMLVWCLCGARALVFSRCFGRLMSHDAWLLKSEDLLTFSQTGPKMRFCCTSLQIVFNIFPCEIRRHAWHGLS